VASKWGVIGFTESLRYELAHRPIGFTLFCPSFVDTGMFAGARPPLFTRMLTPEVAVDRAYEGFRRGEYLIVEPFMAKLTPALKGLLPTWLFDVLARTLGVTRSMEAWREIRRRGSSGAGA
jgi:short-subunit dehydrogenase